MVDFNKHIKQKVKVDFRNLLLLFETLDRQTSHIDLRPIQIETLNLLSERRNDKDIILKLSTGAGKTSIGLLYLFSILEEFHKPVVYLCPTVQLTEQVLLEAKKLGIPSFIYPAGQTHPAVDCISGKAIIICTYDKLFNAKTTFDRPDVLLRPQAFVLDDVHAGIEEIRDSFTLTIEVGASLHATISRILHEPCLKYKSSCWLSILDLDPQQFMEVPYWIWKPLLPEIEAALHQNKESYKFVLPYLLDILRWCRCVVSGIGIEITPLIIPINKSDAFNNSQNRLFMSATLADDSVLVRELGCNIESAKNPVIPSKDKGLGERMVIAPSLASPVLDRKWVMNLCSSISKKYNVVVLSPSEYSAREWESVGAHVYMGNDVSVAVNELKIQTNSPSLSVFVNRYDGIDLPDNACRVLVIDGLPMGDGIVDKFDSSMFSTPGGVRNRLIYRIEQGMGRAVRSHVDYAVILLVGPEIGHFIAKHDVLSSMNVDTQTQLNLALELAKMAVDDNASSPGRAVSDLIKQCLNRDEGWKQFYNENIRKVEKSIAPSSTSKLDLSLAERMSFDAALLNDLNRSVGILRSSLNSITGLDDQVKGWYLQRIANYLYDINPGESLEAQRSACEKYKSLFIPPNLVKRAVKLSKFNIQQSIVSYFKQFTNPNGIIAQLEDLKSRLSYDNSPSCVEQSICDLSMLVGANGSRPENDYGEGPDDLWLWPNISLVIEAKNQNQDSLHKSDSGQLHISLKWFKDTYPELSDPIPVIFSKVSVSDKRSGFPDHTRVITPSCMSDYLNAIGNFYNSLISQLELLQNFSEIAKTQQCFNLLPEQFVSNFTVQLKES